MALMRNKIPICLIPDIRGNSKVFINITRELNGESVYPWHDQRYVFSESPTDIVGLAEHIAHGIIAIHKKNNLPPTTPCLVAGYSFGCALMTEVIKQLKNQNKTVYAVAIDSPPVPVSKAYFRPNNLSATQDLLDIVKLNALETQLIPRDSLNELKVDETISAKPINEQLEAIEAACLKAHGDSSHLSAFAKGQFANMTQIVTQNYSSLSEYKVDASVKPDKLLVIMTEQTLKKYGKTNQPDGGWGEFYGLGPEDVVVPKDLSGFLKDTAHTQLPDALHASTVAKMMLDYFKQVLQKQSLEMTGSDQALQKKDLEHEIDGYLLRPPRFLMTPSPVSPGTSPASDTSSSPENSPIHAKSYKIHMEILPQESLKDKKLDNKKITPPIKIPKKLREYHDSSTPSPARFFDAKNYKTSSLKGGKKPIKLRSSSDSNPGPCLRRGHS